MLPSLLRIEAFQTSEVGDFEGKEILFQTILNGRPNARISVENFYDFSQRVKQERVRC